MPHETIHVGTDLIRRQSLEAVVIFACQCGAPGVYKSHESIRDGWPGCYVEPGDPRDTKSVGDICPHCGRVRGAGKDLGEIWSREWRAGNAHPLRGLLNWFANVAKARARTFTKPT